MSATNHTGTDGERPLVPVTIIALLRPNSSTWSKRLLPGVLVLGDGISQVLRTHALSSSALAGRWPNLRAPTGSASICSSPQPSSPPKPVGCVMTVTAHQHKTGIGHRQPPSPHIRPGFWPIRKLIGRMMNFKVLGAPAHNAQIVKSLVDPPARFSPYWAPQKSQILSFPVRKLSLQTPLSLFR